MKINKSNHQSRRGTVSQQRMLVVKHFFFLCQAEFHYNNRIKLIDALAELSQLPRGCRGPCGKVIFFFCCFVIVGGPSHALTVSHSLQSNCGNWGKVKHQFVNGEQIWEK